MQRAETRPCAHCGEGFRAVNDYAGRPPQKFCSPACRLAGRAIPECSCLACGVVFKPAKRATVYCGQACRDAHYRERLKGDASHFWQGGRTATNKLLRSSAAYAEWRTAVFKRDDYRCVTCGARSKAGAPVVLHADHIKPLSAHPDLALDVDNGRTLCEPCHKETDTWAWRQRWKQSNALAGKETLE